MLWYGYVRGLEVLTDVIITDDIVKMLYEFVHVKRHALRLRDLPQSTNSN